MELLRKLRDQEPWSHGSEAFHRAVTDYFQRSYASMGGQLSVVFAAGRI